MVIADLAEMHLWTYEEAMERFFRSSTCKNLSDERTGMFTLAPIEIIEMFEEELSQLQP